MGLEDDEDTKFVLTHNVWWLPLVAEVSQVLVNSSPNIIIEIVVIFRVLLHKD